MQSRFAQLIATGVFVLATTPSLLAQANAQSSASSGQTAPVSFGAGAYRPGPGVTMPVATERPAPKYPTDGPAAHAAGVIVVEVVVRHDGTVGEVRVLNDSTNGQWPSLVQAVTDAAHLWRFTPGERAGLAADVIVPIAFTFNLANPSGRDQLSLVYPQGLPGLVNPRPTHVEAPQYTSSAMRARIQGQVTMRVVVDPTGAVTAATVVRSLDPVLGLDQQALIAAKRWTFEPARFNGVPVTSSVSIVLTFKLH